METIFERVGALDVHKAQVTACVRVPDGSGRREARVAEFATTVAGLLALEGWLQAFAVTHVAMEATGVYWQPVWAILEEGFELMLVNARHVKTSGMKTAISIPDDLFRRADELAGRLGKSRSELYREALADYVARRDTGAVTAALNEIADEVAADRAGFGDRAARRVLERDEW